MLYFSRFDSITAAAGTGGELDSDFIKKIIFSYMDIPNLFALGYQCYLRFWISGECPPSVCRFFVVFLFENFITLLCADTVAMPTGEENEISTVRTASIYLNSRSEEISLGFQSSNVRRLMGDAERGPSADPHSPS